MKRTKNKSVNFTVIKCRVYVHLDISMREYKFEPSIEEIYLQRN